MSVVDPAKQTSSLTVLLIDDDERDLLHWTNTLRDLRKDYTVLTARDRSSCLTLCKNVTIDCVLLDLDMPESGFDLLLELVPDSKRPAIAVVILTRLNYPTLCEVAKNAGAQDWLVKRHTSAEQLDNAIHRAVLAVKSGQGH